MTHVINFYLPVLLIKRNLMSPVVITVNNNRLGMLLELAKILTRERL